MAQSRAAPAGTAADTRPIFAILSASNFVIGLGAFGLVGLIEPMAEGLGVSAAVVAGLLTVYALGIALCSPVLVALTGRVGRRRVLAAGMGLVIVATGIAALAPSMAVLYPARVMAAAGAGLVTPVSLAIATTLAPPEKRGQALSAVFLGITLSQVAGVPVGTWLSYTYGWRALLALVLLLGLPCLWLIWTRVPAGLRVPPVSLVDLGRVLRDPLPLLTVGYTVVFLASIYVVFTYLPLLMSERMGFGRDGISLVLLLFGAGAPVGNVIGGWMADRLGAARSLTLICLGEAALLPVFSYLPLPVGGLLAFVLVWSVIGWLFSAPQQLRLVALNPDLAQVLLSLHAASIYVGIAVGSALASLLFARFGLDVLGWAASLGMLLALAVLWGAGRYAAARRG